MREANWREDRDELLGRQMGFFFFLFFLILGDGNKENI